MGFINITKVGMTANSGVNQSLTVSYRLAADPDISASYTVVSTNVQALPNGNLITPMEITGLADGQQYVLRVVNNCGGTGTIQTFNT